MAKKFCQITFLLALGFVGLCQIQIGSSEEVGYDQCMWIGHSPFCFGSCPENYQEIRKASKNPGYTDVREPFGRSCLTGTKKLCCKSKRSNPTFLAPKPNLPPQQDKFLPNFGEDQQKKEPLPLPPSKGNSGNKNPFEDYETGFPGGPGSKKDGKDKKLEPSSTVPAGQGSGPFGDKQKDDAPPSFLGKPSSGGNPNKDPLGDSFNSRPQFPPGNKDDDFPPLPSAGEGPGSTKLFANKPSNAGPNGVPLLNGQQGPGNPLFADVVRGREPPKQAGGAAGEPEGQKKINFPVEEGDDIDRFLGGQRRRISPF